VSARRGNRWLVVACVCGLAALVLMTWQIVDPTVWPVMVAMSLGQLLGTASFAAFGYVFWAEHRLRRRAENAAKTGVVQGVQAVRPKGDAPGEMPSAVGEAPPP
jgi:hypothetical protein